MSQQNQPSGKADRSSQILDLLIDGHSREEISIQLGYSTWKSLDIYMRRHGFTWDSQRRIYTQIVREAVAEEDPVESKPSSRKPSPNNLINGAEDSQSTNLTDIKPQEVVRLFGLGILDAREIAKKTGFPGHKEMAAYMRRQGYIWSSADLNYASSDPVLPVTVPDAALNEESLVKKSGLQSLSSLVGIPTQENYLALLDFLWQSREQLAQMLESKKDDEKLQIYHLQGQAKTKSIFLSEGLIEMMSSLCEKHSLSQKQGYEAALVEYLTKHGFREQINALRGLHNSKQTQAPK